MYHFDIIKPMGYRIRTWLSPPEVEKKCAFKSISATFLGRELNPAEHAQVIR